MTTWIIIFVCGLILGGFYELSNTGPSLIKTIFILIVAPAMIAAMGFLTLWFYEGGMWPFALITGLFFLKLMKDFIPWFWYDVIMDTWHHFRPVPRIKL